MQNFPLGLTGKVHGRMMLSLGCSSCIPSLPPTPGMVMDPVFALDLQEGLRVRICGPSRSSICLAYSLQDKQLRTMKVSEQVAQPSDLGGGLTSRLLGRSRRGGVINFYAYHCQDHLLIQGRRLEMSPYKLSQSLHPGAWLAGLHWA